MSSKTVAGGGFGVPLVGLKVFQIVIIGGIERSFFYKYRRDVLGMDETQARAEMEAIWHPEGVWAAFVDR